MNNKYGLLAFFFLLASLLGFFHSCQEDNFDTSPDITLDFSVDTLRFDTVFTQLGSATRILKAYNTSSNPIEIQKIFLENGNTSKFRMNVDGYTVGANGNIFNQNGDTGEPLPPIPIAGNDSVYIFMEVTIDPDDPLSVSPFVIYEKLKFETNGNNQEVTLEAFGQNANYFPSRFSGGTINRYTCNMGIETWNDPKPYVIYGILIVDSCELVIPAGTKIYVHGGLVNAGEGEFYNDGIWLFGPDARLRLEGELNNPIVIQGDRLEEPFQDVSGQWAGIRLFTGNNVHTVNHTIIKNSIVGIRVDSLANLDISNTQIRNTSGPGLLGVHANINAENCLVVDNGANSLQLVFGGEYDFKHCTFANYGTDLSAVQLTNVLCLDELCGDCLGNDLNAKFTNCIIAGSRDDEIGFFDRNCNGEAFNVNFENCIVRVNDLLEDYPDFFTNNCIPGTCFNLPDDENLFFDSFEGDFHLDTLSFAEEKGIPIPGLDTDLDGMPRDLAMPDLGCYEYIY